MQICSVNSRAEKEGTKRDKGWKRDSEEGESWLTVCRWFIIVIIWRGFLLTTRPTLVLLSFSSQSVDLTDTSLNNTSSLVCDYPSHNFPSSSFLLLFISTFRSSLFVSSFPFFIFTSFCVVSHPPFFLSIFQYFFLFLSISFFPIFYFTFQSALPLFDSKSLFLFIPSFYGFRSVPFHPFDPFFLTYRTQYAAFSLQSVCETYCRCFHIYCSLF